MGRPNSLPVANDSNSRSKQKKASQKQVGQESKPCEVKSSAKKSSTNSYASVSQLMELIERQGYQCNLSGLPLVVETAVLDHIKPIQSGGGHDIGNLQWLHSSVNKMKHTLSQERFVELCRMVVEKSGE